MGAELKDKIFISTRPANGADELPGLFANAGATLLEMPLIEIFSKPLNDPEKQAISNLEEFQWLIFTSSNGVKYFFQNLNPCQIPNPKNTSGMMICIKYLAKNSTLVAK